MQQNDSSNRPELSLDPSVIENCVDLVLRSTGSEKSGPLLGLYMQAALSVCQETGLPLSQYLILDPHMDLAAQVLDRSLSQRIQIVRPSNVSIFAGIDPFIRLGGGKI